MKGIKREDFDASLAAPAEPRKLPQFIQREANVKPNEVDVFDSHFTDNKQRRHRDNMIPAYEATRFQALKRQHSDGDLVEILSEAPQRTVNVSPAPAESKTARHRRNKSDGMVLKNRPKFDDMV